MRSNTGNNNDYHQGQYSNQYHSQNDSRNYSRPTPGQNSTVTFFIVKILRAPPQLTPDKIPARTTIAKNMAQKLTESRNSNFMLTKICVGPSVMKLGRRIFLGRRFTLMTPHWMSFSKMGKLCCAMSQSAGNL
jgi:hypothetical protein